MIRHRHKRFSWCLRADTVALILAGLCCSFAQASAADTVQAADVLTLDAASTAKGGEQTLYLDVVLNQVVTGQLIPVLQRGRQLLVDSATLTALGLRLTAAELTRPTWPLDELPDLTYRYDLPNQRLLLTVPILRLSRPVLQLHERGNQTDAGRDAQLVPALSPLVSGLALGYDIYGNRSNDQTHLSAWSELRLFGVGPGLWRNSMLNQYASSGIAGQRTKNIRLDTQWQWDDPASMVSVTVGDSVTGALSWTRATRIGGVKIARDFSLQPYRVTTPLALLKGESALPSTVDLLINGFKQNSFNVPPGAFEINAVPAFNGQGQAQLVITDINGQQRTIDVSLYGSAQLLQAGLSDWSLELGQVREDYGVRSFGYRDAPMLSATGRYGWSNRTTLEGHVEADKNVQMLGIGGLWRLGERAGILNAALAASRHGSKSGQQLNLGYQWGAGEFNFGASAMRRSRDFRDVASLNETYWAKANESLSASLNTVWGNFGIGFVQQRYYNDQSGSRYASLNWSRYFSNAATLSFSLVHNLQDSSAGSVYASFSMPLQRYLNTSVSVQHRRDDMQLTVGATRMEDPDQGSMGWRLEASTGRHQSRLQGDMSQLGEYGRWQVGASAANKGDSHAVFGGLNGSLLWTQGQLRATRNVDDAFAIVSTNGFADIPVRLENRPVGRTSADGFLFINRLNAYQRNQLSIDPMGLPANVRLETPQQAVVPPRGAGVMADFGLRRVHSVQITLVNRAGEPLPVGTKAWLQSPTDSALQPLMVGYDGLVYVEDYTSGAVINVNDGGLRCRAPLPAPQMDGAQSYEWRTVHCE